jgi:hypothetical protein
MAVHVQGRAEFTGINDEDWRIDIVHLAGATTNAVEFFVGGDGFVLNYDNAGEFEECPTIMGSSVSFTMMFDPDNRSHFQGLFDDFNADPEGEWAVAIYKDPDGTNTLYWVGTILPEGIVVEDISPHEQVTITAVDGLGQLDGIDFNDGGTAYQGATSYGVILWEALKKVPHIDYWQGTDDFLYIFEDFVASNYSGYAAPVTTPTFISLFSQITHETFHNVDNDGEPRYFSAKEVIESLCKTLNCTMFMYEGKFWFMPLGVKQSQTSAQAIIIKKSGTTGATSAITFGKTFGGNTGNFYKRRGWVRTAAPPYKEVKLTRNYQGDKPVVLKSNYTSANMAASLVLDDEDATYEQDLRFKVGGNLMYRHTGIPTGTTDTNRYGRIVLKISLRLGDGDGSTDYYLKRNYSIGTTSFIHASLNGYNNDFPTNLELGADAYDDITWTNTDTDRFQIVCPFVIDREQGIGPNLTDGAYINYRFDLVTPPLTAARDGLQMFLNITSIQADGTTTTDFTDTNYADYSVRNFKCAIFDDAQEQEFGTVDITATGDQGRFELDLGETLVGDRITSMDHGIIKVYDGSTYVDATDWRSLNSTTASLGINKLAVRERMAFHRTGKRMERGQLIGTGNGYLAPYTVLTDAEDSNVYFLTALRYVATDDEYDATLILSSRDVTGITEAQDNPQPSKDVTPPDAGNVPKPAMLGGTANNIVNTSYVSYNPLARSRFGTSWTAVVGSETMEGYWTITNDGVGKYIDHQGEVTPVGYYKQRAVYVLAKGQGSNTDTYTQPAAVQPTQGDSLNTTLALIQEYMNRVGTDSSYTFLITYDEVSASANKLLDDYPGAAAAYSLRKLDKDYTGDAIRVRRASDNTEQDIGFDGNGDLDTSALATFCSGTDGFVKVWYDQAGGNDVEQTTTANQPKIYDSSTGVILDEDNNLPAAFFAGDYLNSGTVSATGTATNFAVGNISGGSGNRALFYTPEVFNFFNGTLWKFLTISTQVTYDSSSFDELGLHYFGANASQGFGALNGGSVTTNAQGAGSGTKIAIGTQANNGIPFYGYIQECIYYASDETSDRTGIETNINDYYDIY